MRTEKKDLSELVERTTVYPLTEDGEQFLEFNLPASLKRALTLLENAGIIQDYYYSKGKLAIALLLEKPDPDDEVAIAVRYGGETIIVRENQLKYGVRAAKNSGHTETLGAIAYNESKLRKFEVDIRVNQNGDALPGRVRRLNAYNETVDELLLRLIDTEEPAPVDSDDGLGPHCAYPGHATRRTCPTKRYTVIAPKDKLGRARTFEVCADAVEFARNRGYEIVGERERTE